MFSIYRILPAAAAIASAGLGVSGITLGTKAFLQEDGGSVKRYIFEEGQSPGEYYVCNWNKNLGYKCGGLHGNRDIKYSTDPYKFHRDLVEWRNQQPKKIREVSNSFSSELCEKVFLMFPGLCTVKKDVKK